jgi:hypothetical protein
MYACARVKRRLFVAYLYFTLDVIGEEAVLLAYLYLHEMRLAERQ